MSIVSRLRSQALEITHTHTHRGTSESLWKMEYKDKFILVQTLAKSMYMWELQKFMENVYYEKTCPVLENI